MRCLIPFLVSSIAALDLASADGVMIPGQTCGPDRHFSSLQILGSGLRADTSGDQTMFCPARLPDTQAGQARDLTWARATVDDRNSSVGFSCWVEGRTSAGGIYRSASKTTGSSYTGLTTLLWSHPLNGGSPIGAVGALSLNCTTPAATPTPSELLGVGLGQ